MRQRYLALGRSGYCAGMLPGAWMMLVGACGRADRYDLAADVEWGVVTGSVDATRHSSLRQITPANVKMLEEAWRLRVEDFPLGAYTPEGAQDPRFGRITVNAPCPGCRSVEARFEATPVMRWGRVFVQTPRSRVIALDPASGAVQWTFDPGIDVGRTYPEGLTSRGVAVWEDPRNGACARRVFSGTVDGRLIALDAQSGVPCSEFGRRGEVHRGGPSRPSASHVSLTSPPLVVGDVVVAGGTFAEAGGKSQPSVVAYDVRTGELRWQFDPEVPWRETVARSDMPAGTHHGGGRVWSILSADEERDLLFLPTSSAQPQFVGVSRPGRNEYASSVVAVRASSGKFVWGFQVVKHDLWDYDVAAPPLLVTVERRGQKVPALVVGTKMGMLFLLDRRTGKELSPVGEEAVPSSRIEGEAVSPTQLFPVKALRLHGLGLSPDSAFGVTPEDRKYCRERLAALHNLGTYTPPDTQETLVWPGFWGGINWDGMAWDPSRSLLIVAQKRLAMSVKLLPEEQLSGASGEGDFDGARLFGQGSSGYFAKRRPLVSKTGTPCSPPPWSEIIALRLTETVREIWRAPLGTVPWLANYSGYQRWGALAFGGPLTTGGGVTFIAAASDDSLRALETETGAVLWSTRLPAGGQSAPMTYAYRGRQYLVIAAGGRSGVGTPGDWVMAYSLRRP